MIAEHFDAVRALLPARWTVYDTDAGHEPAFPYIVLWGGDFGRYSVDLAHSQEEVAGDIGVTCVALAAGAARHIQSEIAALLDGAVIEVPGRRGFELVEREVRPVTLDREVQIPSGGTARYPFYGVVTYRVESTGGSA